MALASTTRLVALAALAAAGLGASSFDPPARPDRAAATRLFVHIVPGQHVDLLTADRTDAAVQWTRLRLPVTNGGEGAPACLDRQVSVRRDIDIVDSIAQQPSAAIRREVRLVAAGAGPEPTDLRLFPEPKGMMLLDGQRPTQPLRLREVIRPSPLYARLMHRIAIAAPCVGGDSL